jgi:hypothetical protein
LQDLELAPFERAHPRVRFHDRHTDTLVRTHVRCNTNSTLH